MSNPVNPLNIATTLRQTWSPKIIAEFDNYYVKTVKLHGQFVWHKHLSEDEMFLILKGQLVIEQRNLSVTLMEGDLFVVKKGVEHNPIADEECLVLLIESKSTKHTGDVIHAQTKSIQQQLE